MENLVQIVDDLPADARQVVEKVAAQVSKIQDRADREAAAIRERADREIEDLTEKARQKVQAQVEKMLAELKPLQNAYAREGQLDEALAIREQIKQLKGYQGGAESDPGNVVHLHSQLGKSFLFDVTGETAGAVWGTDVYTSDSALAVAAVHAGKVQPGERKTVRVTIVRPPASFRGSTRNGVTTAPFGAYPGAYRFD